MYFWSTYQSLTCLILFLHLCLECFTLLPSGADLCLLGRGGWGKAKNSCYGLSGTQASIENLAKLCRGEGAGAFHYSAGSRCVCMFFFCMCVCVCVTAYNVLIDGKKNVKDVGCGPKGLII